MSFLWMLGSSGLSGISVSGLQLGCNIFEQPQVKNSSCGRNQTHLSGQRASKGWAQALDLQRRSTSAFPVLGRKSPADQGQAKALSLFVCAMLGYHWCYQSSRGISLWTTCTWFLEQVIFPEDKCLEPAIPQGSGWISRFSTWTCLSSVCPAGQLHKELPPP